MDWTARVADKAPRPLLVTTTGSDAMDPPPPEPLHHAGFGFRKVLAVSALTTVVLGGSYIAHHKEAPLSLKALETAEYVAKGFHAIPAQKDDLIKTLPSMHRLLNVVGMVGGFAGVQYLSNIAFGCKINGSNCEELKREDVPKPLRFMHKIVTYNPFGDTPHDQWMKVLHQMLPAVGGAIGAIKGSEFFFVKQNEREITAFRNLLKKDKLNPLEADTAMNFAQGKVHRVFAGLMAWVSSASGLTALYGMFLNPAFNFCNGGKFFAGASELTGIKAFRAFSNTTGDLPMNAEKALGEMAKNVEMLMRDASNPAIGDKAIDNFSQRMFNNVHRQFFRNDKLKPEEERIIVSQIRNHVHRFVQEAQKSGLKPSEVAAKIKADVLKQLNSQELREMGEGMVVGQGGILGKAAEWVAKTVGQGKVFDDIRAKAGLSTPSRGRG